MAEEDDDEDFLDTSQAFNTCSGCNSYGSDELQRIAASTIKSYIEGFESASVVVKRSAAAMIRFRAKNGSIHRVLMDKLRAPLVLIPLLHLYADASRFYNWNSFESSKVAEVFSFTIELFLCSINLDRIGCFQLSAIECTFCLVPTQNCVRFWLILVMSFAIWKAHKWKEKEIKNTGSIEPLIILDVNPTKLVAASILNVIFIVPKLDQKSFWNDSICREIDASKVHVIYSSWYGIALMGIEKLHPFNSSKWDHICEFLIKDGVRLKLIGTGHGTKEVEDYFDSFPNELRSLKVYGALLECHVHAKSMEKEELIMQEMKELGYFKPLLSSNVMLKFYFETRNYPKLEALAKEMEGKGIVADRYTLSYQLKAYAAKSDIEGVGKIVAKIRAGPSISADWNIYVATCNEYLEASLKIRDLTIISSHIEQATVLSRKGLSQLELEDACAGLPVITGYLLARSIIGPGGLNFVSEMVQVETVAPFGVDGRTVSNADIDFYSEDDPERNSKLLRLGRQLKEFDEDVQRHNELLKVIEWIPSSKIGKIAAIVGDSKVSSKIGVFKLLLEKVDILLLSAGMIFTFYKAQGLSVGSSLVKEDKLEVATSLMTKGSEFLVISGIGINGIRIAKKAFISEAVNSLNLESTTELKGSNVAATRFKGPILVEALGWLSSQFSVLYGKFLALNMFNPWVLTAAIHAFVQGYQTGEIPWYNSFIAVYGEFISSANFLKVMKALIHCANFGEITKLIIIGMIRSSNNLHKYMATRISAPVLIYKALKIMPRKVILVQVLPVSI